MPSFRYIAFQILKVASSLPLDTATSTLLLTVLHHSQVFTIHHRSIIFHNFLEFHSTFKQPSEKKDFCHKFSFDNGFKPHSSPPPPPPYHPKSAKCDKSRQVPYAPVVLQPSCFCVTPGFINLASQLYVHLFLSTQLASRFSRQVASKQGVDQLGRRIEVEKVVHTPVPSIHPSIHDYDPDNWISLAKNEMHLANDSY